MLSNFQQQVNTIKSEALKRCAASVGEKDFKFDNLVAIIKADKPIVLEGDEYKAEVVLGAYDSKASPVITINGSPITVKDGKGEYKVRASGQGNKKLKAVITVNNAGESKSYDTETEYQVPEIIVEEIRDQVLP
jgi:gliding motility-associated protein GldM